MLKTLTRAGAMLALLAAPTTAFARQPAAQAAPAPTQDADPALWVVKDADTTIYLFGTIHILKPGLSWFDEAVKDAFDKSDKVMLEVVEPDAATMQGLIVKYAYNGTEGPTLTERLPEEKRAAYAAAMTDVGIPPAAFDRMDPWLPAITLSVASLPKYGYDPNAGAERTLAAAAREAGKPVEGLETIEQQLGYFDNLPAPLQISYLVKTVDELPKLGTELDKMVTSWSKGDPDTLAAELNEGMRETPELAKILLAERNARWADWIAARLAQPGTVFVAVGAGHLAGGDSVQAFLARRHIAATRVQY